jgi:hypothetical protein
MMRPFLLEIDGDTWSCATDGTAILALKGAEPGLVTPADVSPQVAAYLTMGPPHRLIAPRASVDAFLADATAELSVVCRRCNGAAPEPTKCERCAGHGQVECGECGHKKDCPDCSGNGSLGGCIGCEGDKTNRPEPKPGQVAPGVAVDRNLLKRALGQLRPEQIAIGYSSQLEPVVLEDDSREWRIVIMPMRELSVSELPALFIAGIGAAKEWPEAGGGK